MNRFEDNLVEKNLYTVELHENYGGLLKRIPYNIQKEGPDWILVKHDGQTTYVPKGLIVTEKELKKEKRKEQRILKDYEDFIE